MSRQVLAIATIAAVTGLTGTLAIALNAQQAPRPRPRAAAVEPLPAPGGDVKTVLYNWANHMGMLRGVQENDAIGTLDYVGTGTINVGGQPCRLTKYHAEINYQMSGMREDFACTLPNGQKREEIRVIGGQYAWNEIGGPGQGGQAERWRRDEGLGRRRKNGAHISDSWRDRSDGQGHAHVRAGERRLHEELRGTHRRAAGRHRH